MEKLDGYIVTDMQAASQIPLPSPRPSRSINSYLPSSTRRSHYQLQDKERCPELDDVCFGIEAAVEIRSCCRNGHRQQELLAAGQFIARYSSGSGAEHSRQKAVGRRQPSLTGNRRSE